MRIAPNLGTLLPGKSTSVAIVATVERACARRLIARQDAIHTPLPTHAFGVRENVRAKDTFSALESPRAPDGERRSTGARGPHSSACGALTRRTREREREREGEWPVSSKVRCNTSSLEKARTPSLKTHRNTFSNLKPTLGSFQTTTLFLKSGQSVRFEIRSTGIYGAGCFFCWKSRWGDFFWKSRVLEERRGGGDTLVRVRGEWQGSCWGASLEELCARREPSRMGHTVHADMPHIWEPRPLLSLSLEKEKRY